MSKLRPEQGGCWFCETDEETKDWLSSSEFDCLLHQHCLEEEINKGYDKVSETNIFVREFGYELDLCAICQIEESTEQLSNETGYYVCYGCKIAQGEVNG